MVYFYIFWRKAFRLQIHVLKRNTICLLKIKELGFWTRWGCRGKCFTSLLNQKKDNNQFEGREQPEMPNSHLHGGPTTRVLRKHSSRLVGGAEREGRAQRGHEAWQGPWGWSHIHAQISWEEQLPGGSETYCETQDFSRGKLKTQNPWL